MPYLNDTDLDDQIMLSNNSILFFFSVMSSEGLYL